MTCYEDKVCFADGVDIVEKQRPECFDAVGDETFSFQGDV